MVPSINMTISKIGQKMKRYRLAGLQYLKKKEKFPKIKSKEHSPLFSTKDLGVNWTRSLPSPSVVCL